MGGSVEFWGLQLTVQSLPTDTQSPWEAHYSALMDRAIEICVIEQPAKIQRGAKFSKKC